MGSKKCNNCNIEFPLGNFSKDKSAKDGLKNICNYYMVKTYLYTLAQFRVMVINP